MDGEPVYSDSVVVTLESGPPTDTHAVVDIIGTVAGPAGSSAVEFADGSVWEVDHARPGQLVQFSVPVHELASSRIARELIGSERVAEIEAWLNASARRHTTFRLDGDDSNRAVSAPRGSLPRDSRPRRALVAAAIGRRVLAADILDDDGAAPLERVCAGIEFLLELDPDVPPYDLEQLRDSVTASVSAVAADVTDEDLSELAWRDPKTAARVVSMLGGVTRRGTGDELSLLAHRLRGRLDASAGARPAGSEWSAMRAAPIAQASHAVDAMYDVEVRRTPATFDADFQQVEFIKPGLLVVTVVRGDSGRWARVLRREGLVVLALAPLLADGLLQSAELVVPPDVMVDDLVIEVLEVRELPSEVGAAEIIRDAISVGRDAARLERLGRDRQARGRWHACAVLWTRVGDQSRATLAELYAHGSPPQVYQRDTADALVADAIATPVV